MKKLLPILLCTVVLGISNLPAAMIIEFNPFGIPSGTGKPNPFNLTSSPGDVNVGSDVVLNSGLSYGAGVVPGGSVNGWGGPGWDGTSLATATSNNDYYTLTLSAASGYKISYSSIDLNLTRGATSATAFVWQYQINGTGGFTSIGSPIDISGATSKTPYSIDLSGVSALQDVTGTVEFRIYAWGATTNSSLFFGASTGSTDYSALNFNGTIAPVPEPSTLGLMGVGAAFLVLRRKKAKSVL